MGLPCSADQRRIRGAGFNLRWIVRLRWGAVAGQLITILIARPVRALDPSRSFRC